MSTTYRLPVRETLALASAKIKGIKKYILIPTICLSLANLIIFLLDQFVKSIPLKIASKWIIVLLTVIIISGILYFSLQRIRNLPVSFKTLVMGLCPRVVINLLKFYFVIMGGSFALTVLLISYKPLLIFILIPLTVYLFIKTSLAPCFIIDRRIKTLMAIKLSWLATRGNFWPLVKITAVNFFLFLATLLSAGIGIIWSAPFYYILKALVYERLAHQASTPQYSKT